MAALVPPAAEPLSALLHKVRALRAAPRPPLAPARAPAPPPVSVALALGACGAWLAVADTVVIMDRFLPTDGTARAAALVASAGGTGALAPQVPLGGASLNAGRAPVPRSIAAATDGRMIVRGTRTVVWARAVAAGHAHGAGSVPASGGGGSEAPQEAGGEGSVGSAGGFGGSVAAPVTAAADENVLNLEAISQLVEAGQARAIGGALQAAAARLMRSGSDGQPTRGRSLAEVLDSLEAEFDARLLGDVVGLPASGQLARPRRLELAAAFNRLRGAEFTMAPGAAAAPQQPSALAAALDDWEDETLGTK